VAMSHGDNFLDKMKKSLGKELVFEAPEEIGRGLFRMYALAIGDMNPMYTDQKFAKKHNLRDVMAPPTLICDTWQYVQTDCITDGGYMAGHGEVLEFVGLRSGNSYEFFRPVHPDDVITTYWRVKDVSEKTGRSGKLVFWDIEMSYYNQNKQLLAKNTESYFERV
jgi:acyl dehydratase